jgi:glycine/D-amino acid oxidase-like deaminating enzyme
MRRREFLKGAGFGLASLSIAAQAAAEGCLPGMPTIIGPDGPMPLPLVRADPDRIISLTVCTRPFRSEGVRLETQKLGRKTIVHNYGHGGAGWSLSWGSAEIAVRQVLQTKAREIAVIGCGVVGLTSALTAQRAGLKVRIYAKDRPPDVRSMFATGNWSPGSRYCTRDAGTPEVIQRWEEMARISHRVFQNMLGLPGDPIEWRDGYRLSDKPFGTPGVPPEGEPAYPSLEPRLRDIMPRSHILDPGTHPFPVPNVFRFANIIFNLTSLSRLLISDFLAAGGVIETREFVTPADISRLRERTVINATGYGARALFGDESLVPVRGQLMRLIPQPEITYGMSYDDHFYMLPRRDGILLQSPGVGDFGNADTTPNRAEAGATVLRVAELNQRIRAGLACP